MTITVVEGDLLDQPVDIFVNAWNRNFIPWWLMLPQVVSGAIKRRAGTTPASVWSLPTGRCRADLGGSAAVTAGIIHVAGINLLWRASEWSIPNSVRSAVRLAVEHGDRSLAFPLVGAGSGGFDADRATEIMLDELRSILSSKSPSSVTGNNVGEMVVS
ncbi:MAG TPA: macro domain-containing protein [Isosphaeraceae bacterium]|nr:macro domain-containing protein [Isosphaeraceae bacterium]